jgi:hypothetical protein
MMSELKGTAPRDRREQKCSEQACHQREPAIASM